MIPKRIYWRPQSVVGTTTIYLVGSGTGSWTPNTSANVKAECFGGGQTGNNVGTNRFGGAGAGYAAKNVIAVIAGTPVAFSIGAAGTGVTGNGQDTWFSSSGTVIANGGGSGTTQIGDTTHTGGSGGGGGSGNNGGGGGGGAGPHGNGGAGGHGDSNGVGGGGGNGGGTAGQSGTNGSAGGSAFAGTNGAGGSNSGGAGGSDYDAGGGGGWDPLESTCRHASLSIL